jgi:hypothetical protein
MALVEIGATVLGAFISGIIGLLVVEYRDIKETYDRQRKWYTTIKRISERITRVESESYGSNGARQARNTCAGAHKELAQRLNKAPNDIDSEVLNEVEELVGKCQYVISLSEEEAIKSPDVTRNRVSDAAEHARSVIAMAEREREKVGCW